MSHNDSSRPGDGFDGNGRRTPALARFLLVAAVAASISGLAGSASAQTPATPSTPPSEPATQTPAQPAPEQQPLTPEQQIPQQPYLLQAPGRPPITPATPPGTTIPAWTPPVAPAPSQTNIPAPFIGATPGAGGPFVAPGIPSAFAPTVANLGRATLEFHPTLRLSEEYSDNFFQASSGAESNFRSTLGPGFSLLLNGARTFGTLSTTVDLVHDTARNSGDDPKVFPSFNAAVRYSLTPRLALTVIDTFVRSDSATALDPNGIRNGRQTSMVNSFTTSLDWLIDRVATQAYYRNNWFINEDDDNNNGNVNATTSRGNSISHILGVNASTRVATDYLIRAGYEFGRTDVYDGGTGNDTTSHTVHGSASRQFGLYTTGGVQTSYSLQTDENARIWNASIFGAYGLPTGFSISAAVGYSILTSDTEDDGSVSANVAASYRFARTVFSVGVFQDFRQTGQQGGENFGTVESRSYFGSVLYQITPFINVIGQVTYSENTPTGVGNSNNNSTLKTLTYSGGVNWQVLRWLIANARYEYIKRTGQNTFVGGDNNNSGDFAENRVSLNLFATF